MTYEEKVKKLKSSLTQGDQSSNQTSDSRVEKLKKSLRTTEPTETVYDPGQWAKDVNNLYDKISKSQNLDKTSESYLGNQYASQLEVLLKAGERYKTEYPDVLDTMSQNISALRNEGWSYKPTEEELKAYQAQQEQNAKYAAYDVQKGEAEIKDLENQLSQMKQNAEVARTSNLVGNTHFGGVRQDVTVDENQIKELENLISEKKREYTLSKRYQDSENFKLVQNNADFSQKSIYTPSEDDIYNWINDPKFREEYESAYQSIPNPGARKSEFARKGYNYMKPEEVELYNYYYQTEPEKAQEYLKNLEETLNYRAGAEIASGFEGKTGLEIAYGAAAGLSQFDTGMKGLVGAIKGEEYIPVSRQQYAGSAIREDLGNGLKLPSWLGGGTVGQAAYDLASTTANMAPSILASAAIGMVSPLGAAAGSALMGGSASGNAYQSAVNEGYDKESAKKYAAAIGVAETSMQYLLGGISSLGGMSSKITTAMNGIDNGMLRFFARYGANMASEGLEEGLQEVLDPILSNAILGTDEDVNWSEVTYSALLGALSAGVLEGPAQINTSVREANLEKMDSTPVVEEGLKSAEGTDSRSLAEQFSKQVESGKKLTGAQISQLIEANRDQALPKALKAVKDDAERRLNELGETENPEEIADIIARYLLGQPYTKEEKTRLVSSKFGSKVVKAMTTLKAEFKAVGNNVGKNRRIGNVSIDGKETSLDKLTAKKKDGSIIWTDGETEGSFGQMTFEDEITSDIYEGVSNIENITPVAANTFTDIIDKSKNISAQLNGLDEAFTYGFHDYSQEDMKFGDFAPKLTEEQRNDAYQLGKMARNDADSSKVEWVKLNTAPKELTITIDHGNGNVEIINDTSEYNGSAAVELAKVLHQLKIGTEIQFFESYISNGKRVFKDESGNEVDAYAGAYFSGGKIRIDLNAYSGRGLAVNALSHELVHFIAEWSPDKYKALGEYLNEVYRDSDLTMHERVIREQNRLKSLRNEDISYAEAYEEVVANALNRMFDDGTLVEKIQEIRSRDKDLGDKIIEGIKKFIEKFRKVFLNNQSLFHDTADLMEMKDAVENIRNMFAEALVEASDNFSREEVKAVESFDGAEVESNSEGLLIAKKDNVVMYSEKTYKNGGRDHLKKALKENGHTQSEIDETLGYVDDALDYIKILASGYARKQGYKALADHLEAEIITNVKTGKQVMSAIVNNGDYPVNIDLSLICKKRVAYMNVMSRLIRDGVFDRVDYSGEAIASVNDILRGNGFETACLGCFVESRRLQFQAWAESIVNEWNSEVEKRNPDADYFGFAKEIKEFTDEQAERLTKELESNKLNDQGNVNLGVGSSVDRMGRLMDAVPSLRRKLTVEDLLTPEGLKELRKYDGSLYSIVKSRYGAASPKIVQDFNPYASEIAMITFSTVKNLTNNSVKGAQAYAREVKKEYPIKKLKGESNADFKKRKKLNNTKIQDEAMRRYLYDIGGARIQSFSDFMIENVFDYIQIMADLSAKRLPLHGYTKEIVCIRLFGMTGAKWNGSLIAHVDRSMGKEYAGLMPVSKDTIRVEVDGEEFGIGFDDYQRNLKDKSFIQSIGMKDIIALQFDPRYAPYVGSITIGVSDKQILAMLGSPLFRMVIPYHSSGMLPGYAKLVGVDLYNDYTDFQNTTVRQFYDLDGNPVSELRNAKDELIKPDMSFSFNAEVQKTKDARIAADNYLKWCAQRHPVYDGATIKGYVTFNPKFSSSPYGTDFTRHENYYKLLEDFNAYNNITEESALQGPVTMAFPSEENRLTSEQIEEYKENLRSTGIFTEKDIEKYVAKANMTFKDIIDAELKSRADYAKTQSPKWESTVKEIEETLLKDHPRKPTEKKSIQQTDIDYLDAVNRGDMETAQKMVDEAAKMAGFSTEHLYHGTSFFGFTSIDTTESDDSISFFVTNNSEVAQGYMPWYEDDASDRYHEEPRRIGKDIKKRAISTGSSVEKVIEVLNQTFNNQYQNARRATDKETLDSFKVYHIPEMVDAAEELIKRNVPEKIKSLCRLVVEANKKDTFSAWADVSKRYKEFESAEIPYDPDDWSKDILWSRVVVDLQSISKMARTEPVWNNGAVIMKSALVDRYNTYLGGESIGMYDFYGKNENQMVIWGSGSNWKSIPLGKHDAEYRKWLSDVNGNTVPEGKEARGSTRDISEFAKHMGYRSVVFVDIYDAGSYGERGVLSDVYSFFYPQEDIKSADPVTYDENGQVIPLSQRFNPENKDIRYSLSDSDGRQLSSEQQEFFKDSVVRDENGNLKVMYHGTSRGGFNVFDTYGSNYGLFGTGSYFTDSKTIGESYTKKGKGKNPQVYEAYLNIKHPMDMDAAADPAEWAKAFPDADFPESGTNEQFYRAVEEFYADQWMSKWEVAEEIQAGIESNMDYDGITHIGGGRVNPNGERHQVYIAFQPEQIKNVDNANPTDNPDIRYSTQETDNITDRDLLANAFETIAQNSVEYEMIQDYKENVSVLNKLTEELESLRSQIRDARFKNYDKEKLESLTDKANRIAKEIHKYDKRLINMESSGPLRRVIEEERKRARASTVKHTKKVMENRKVRKEQAEARKKIRKKVMEISKILNHGNKKRNVKEDLRGFASETLKLADFLFTDRISDEDLIRRGIDIELSDSQKALVHSAEEILNKIYDQDVSDAEFTALEKQKKKVMDKLKDVLTKQRNKYLEASAYSLFDGIANEYHKLINAEIPSLKSVYDPNVEKMLRSYIDPETLTNIRVKDMDSTDLWKLDNMLAVVLQTIRDANKIFVQSKGQTLEARVSAIMGDFSYTEPDTKIGVIAKNIANKIGWEYEKPVYALERIGSEAFAEMYNNLFNSENIVMKDVEEAKRFMLAAVEKYKYNEWEVGKEIDRDFVDNRGRVFRLTLGQLMSLYAYTRRGIWDHIEFGGFVPKNKGIAVRNVSQAYKLTREQCEAITSHLTEDQKKYVETMQKYLSETMGAKGNEVSMELYGIKMFGEENYFPVRVSGDYKPQARESEAKASQGFQPMTNAGFTHSVTPNAKAPFVLDDFNTMWADHVNEMSRYHGTVLALEDIRRAMNYAVYTDAEADTVSLKAAMKNKYGEDAARYFDDLYREANSGAIQDRLEQLPRKMLGLFRKHAVVYSASVLIQQPGSLNRAFALIPRRFFGVGSLPKNIAGAAFNTKSFQKSYEEMRKYAPGVTIAKEIGGFDTATGGSIRSYLMDTEAKFSQKEILDGVMDFINDNAVANLPNVADKVAWVAIWNACKKETLSKNKAMSPTSDQFLAKVGERFTEVIRATQVYDSIFAKSPMLRSKSLAIQMMVSFMNEPNTVANMVESALRDISRKKNGWVKLGAVASSIIMTNVLKSIVYAMRDDDEEETYIEKYVESIVSGLMQDIQAWNYLPIFRDIASLAQGYDIERADMAIMADLVDAVSKVFRYTSEDISDMTEEELINHDKKVTDATWRLVETIAAFAGVPVKNVRREILSVFNTYETISQKHGMTTPVSLKYTLMEQFGSVPKSEKLYEVIMSGDPYIDRLKATYKDEDAYHSAVRKALREHDPRIKEAAEAYQSGNITVYKNIFNDLKKHFEHDDIQAAIDSEMETRQTGSNSTYSATDFLKAVVIGDTKTAAKMRNEYVSNAKSNGNPNPEEAFEAAVYDSVRSVYKDGILTKNTVKKILVNYTGRSAEEAEDKIVYWDYQKKYSYDISEKRVLDYYDVAEPLGIDIDVYSEFFANFSTLSKKEEVENAIDKLPLSKNQKIAMMILAGYAESTAQKANWH